MYRRTFLKSAALAAGAILARKELEAAPDAAPTEVPLLDLHVR